jgi:hypothetical protein
MKEEDQSEKVLKSERHYSMIIKEQVTKMIDSKKQTIDLLKQVFENAYSQKSRGFAS